jgi:glycosyltransferase involved in cell wall biosynthesis
MAVPSRFAALPLQTRLDPADCSADAGSITLAQNREPTPRPACRAYDSRMRVAFDVGAVRGEPAGVGLYATAMATALFGVLTPPALRLIGRRDDARGLPEGVASQPRSSIPYPVWVEFQSAGDAKRAGSDVVHYSDGIVPFVRHGRTVVAIHDLSVVRLWRTHHAKRWMRIPLVLASPRLADLVLVPSRATADEVVTICGIPASRIEIIPYAPQGDVPPADDGTIAAVLAQYGLQRHGYVLALGTIEPRKNHLRLIEAFEQLVAKHAIDADLRLVIAGKAGWASGRVGRAIAASRVSGRITRLGYVPALDLPALITGAGAVAYVSLYEGFGLPVVEALACGAPTVTSDRSSMPEVAGNAGFLVNPYDVGDIGRGLADAIRAGDSDRDTVRARSMAKASEYTWSRTAQRVVEMYRTLEG